MSVSHAVEHVELGQRQALDAAELDRLADQHGVEPAAAARAAGDGAELVAALAQALADLVEQLGRERPGADAGGVGLVMPSTKPTLSGPMPEPEAAAAATVLEEVTNG